MKPILKKLLKSAIIVIAIVIVFLIGSWAWLSYGSLTPAKEKVFSVLPFPAALVGGRPVTVKAFIGRYNLAQNFAGQNTDNLKASVFDRLIAEKNWKS